VKGTKPMSRCKITVLKKAFFEDIVEKYVTFENYKPCECMTEGQVYYTGGAFGNEKPEGFCDEAWKAIHNYALVLTSGGKVFGQSRCIACCNDGARPVVFMLECVE